MIRIMVFGTFDMIHEGHEDFFDKRDRWLPNRILLFPLRVMFPRRE